MFCTTKNPLACGDTDLHCHSTPNRGETPQRGYPIVEELLHQPVLWHITTRPASFPLGGCSFPRNVPEYSIATFTREGRCLIFTREPLGDNCDRRGCGDPKIITRQCEGVSPRPHQRLLSSMCQMDSLDSKSSSYHCTQVLAPRPYSPSPQTQQASSKLRKIFLFGGTESASRTAQSSLMEFLASSRSYVRSTHEMA